MNIFLNDINLYYEEYGQGPVMLLLHGNGENGRIFTSIIRTFQKSYHVIVIDSRGHGHSDRGKKRLTIPLLAQDILAFIEAKRLNDLTLVGFSDGGNIALEVASAADKVKHLVVIGANLYPFGFHFPVLLGIYFSRIYYGLLSFKPLYKRKYDLYGLMSRQPRIKKKKLSKIKAKTLVIAGQYDMIKRSHTKKISTRIKAAQMKIIPKANHFLVQNNAEELTNLITSFLNNDK